MDDQPESPEDLTSLTDRQLQERAASAIHAAAIMNGSRWADKYHAEIDVIYAECRARSRGIYQRAFNEVAKDQGHHGMVSPAQDGQA